MPGITAGTWGESLSCRNVLSRPTFAWVFLPLGLSPNVARSLTWFSKGCIITHLLTASSREIKNKLKKKEKAESLFHTGLIALPLIKCCHLKYAQALHQQLAVVQGHIQLVLEDEGTGELLIQFGCFWHLVEEEREKQTERPRIRKVIKMLELLPICSLPPVWWGTTPPIFSTLLWHRVLCPTTCFPSSSLWFLNQFFLQGLELQCWRYAPHKLSSSIPFPPAAPACPF